MNDQIQHSGLARRQTWRPAHPWVDPGPERPSGARSRAVDAVAGGMGPVRSREQGVTLVEVLATTTISLILLTTAVPSMYQTIRNNTLTVQANRFTTVLMQARSEARKRNAVAVVCKSADQTSCSTLTNVNWEDGWILFVDASRDGRLNALADEDELVLLTSDGLDGATTLRADSDFADYVAFLPDGRGIGNGDQDPPAEATFRLCDSRGTSHARNVELSPIGRAAVQNDLGAKACP